MRKHEPKNISRVGITRINQVTEDQLVGAYRRALRTPEGELILADLRKMSGIDEQSPVDLTLSEHVAQNEGENWFRYIAGMVSDD